MNAVCVVALPFAWLPQGDGAAFPYAGASPVIIVSISLRAHSSSRTCSMQIDGTDWESSCNTNVLGGV